MLRERTESFKMSMIRKLREQKLEKNGSVHGGNTWLGSNKSLQGHIGTIPGQPISKAVVISHKQMRALLMQDCSSGSF